MDDGIFERGLPVIKRSREIRLLRMGRGAGLLSGGAVLLASCGSGTTAPAPDQGPQEEVMAFESVFDCAAKTKLTEEQCRAERQKAIAQADTTAPRFQDQADCEQDWGEGGCVPHQAQGRSFFSPFIAGFLLGRGGNARAPLFRKAGVGDLFTANGFRLGYAGSPGKYHASSRALEAPRTVAKVKASTGLASRSGFTTSDRTGFSIRSSDSGDSHGG